MAEPIRTVDDVLAYLDSERAKYLNIANDESERLPYHIADAKASILKEVIQRIQYRKHVAEGANNG